MRPYAQTISPHFSFRCICPCCKVLITALLFFIFLGLGDVGGGGWVERRRVERREGEARRRVVVLVRCHCFRVEPNLYRGGRRLPRTRRRRTWCGPLPSERGGYGGHPAVVASLLHEEEQVVSRRVFPDNQVRPVRGGGTRGFGEGLNIESGVLEQETALTRTECEPRRSTLDNATHLNILYQNSAAVVTFRRSLEQGRGVSQMLCCVFRFTIIVRASPEICLLRFLEDRNDSLQR